MAPRIHLLIWPVEDPYVRAVRDQSAQVALSFGCTFSQSTSTWVSTVDMAAVPAGSPVRRGGCLLAFLTSLRPTARLRSTWLWSAIWIRYSRTSATSSEICSRTTASVCAVVDCSGVIHWKISANSAASTMRAVLRFLGVWKGCQSRSAAKVRRVACRASMSNLVVLPSDRSRPQSLTNPGRHPLAGRGDLRAGAGVLSPGRRRWAPCAAVRDDA